MWRLTAPANLERAHTRHETVIVNKLTWYVSDKHARTPHTHTHAHKHMWELDCEGGENVLGVRRVAESAEGGVYDGSKQVKSECWMLCVDTDTARFRCGCVGFVVWPKARFVFHLPPEIKHVFFYAYIAFEREVIVNQENQSRKYKCCIAWNWRQ